MPQALAALPKPTLQRLDEDLATLIAILHAELVERRRWVSEERFLHALNFCMLLPGPEAQQLATYIGWLMHRTRGGIVAGALFVLPSLLILIALSWLYVAYSQVPVGAGVLFGFNTAGPGLGGRGHLTHRTRPPPTFGLSRPPRVPGPGRPTLGGGILSYAGGVQFGLITDRKLSPRPQDIIDGFEPGSEKLLLVSMMRPWAGEAAGDHPAHPTGELPP